MQTHKKLVEAHNGYHNSLIKDIECFNSTSTLYDDMGNPQEYDDWKEDFNAILTTTLQEMNDKDMILQNTHNQLRKMMCREYDIRVVISNVDTCVEQEYIHHLSTFNLFLNQTMDTPDITRKPSR